MNVFRLIDEKILLLCFIFPFWIHIGCQISVVVIFLLDQGGASTQ